MGVRAAPELIVAAAVKENPEIIGLSGLITKSMEQMVETARALKAAGINKKATLLCKNMVNFTIPEKVDFAYIMLGSLYIKSNAEQKSHFDSVARSLKKGGLYFLDWCVQFEPAAYRFESWQTSKRQTKIKFIYQTRMKDYAKQLFEEIITLNINDGGKKKILLQKNLRKAVYPQEFLNFLSLRGDFEFMGWWNNWNLKKPLSGTEKISRPIVIIRRT